MHCYNEPFLSPANYVKWEFKWTLGVGLWIGEFLLSDHGMTRRGAPAAHWWEDVSWLM